MRRLLHRLENQASSTHASYAAMILLLRLTLDDVPVSLRLCNVLRLMIMLLMFVLVAMTLLLVVLVVVR